MSLAKKNAVRSGGGNGNDDDKGVPQASPSLHVLTQKWTCTHNLQLLASPVITIMLLRWAGRHQSRHLLLCHSAGRALHQNPEHLPRAHPAVRHGRAMVPPAARRTAILVLGSSLRFKLDGPTVRQRAGLPAAQCATAALRWCCPRPCNTSVIRL